MLIKYSMNKINTGLYIRVSTDEQAKYGYSIQAQKEKLISYAKLKEWDIYKIYIDEGISGKNLNRKEVQELINDVKKKIVNNVLVYKIDRLTRSTKDLIELIELFKEHDCEFNSLNESIDTTSPTGRMFIKIIGLFAEFERETIVERIKMGLERKVKEGYSIASSTVSYGYEKPKGIKIQKINKKEASIVKKIFLWCKEGKNINQIRKCLENNNITTKKGRKWTNKNIINILSNPNYIGKVRYGINTNKYFEQTGKHKNIINKELYIEVQDKIKNRLKTKEDAYYSNKLICMCNKRLITKRTYIKGKCYINYRCINNKCLFKSISHNYLDKYFKQYRRNKISQKDYIQNTIEKIAILSLKKDKLTVYKSVNTKIKQFTLYKK